MSPPQDVVVTIGSRTHKYFAPFVTRTLSVRTEFDGSYTQNILLRTRHALTAAENAAAIGWGWNDFYSTARISDNGAAVVGVAGLEQDFIEELAALAVQSFNEILGDAS